MKLTVLWMFLALTQVFATGYAQKITLNEKNISLAKVLNNIERQSGYVFIYKDLDLEKIKINIQVKDVSIQQAVDASLKSQPLTYKIVDKTVMIKKTKASVVETVMDFFSVIEVRGKVVDENGQPLQGASVKVKGGTLGTMTYKDGEFVLKGVPEDAVIVVAFLGYKPQELKASLSLGVIRMEFATSELQEVTVSTGYWETSKQLNVGNIAKVTSKEIGNQPVVSPLLALQGRIAGLEITMPANSTPGIAPIIRIRGNNSLRMSTRIIDGIPSSVGLENDGNYPLYVIDGVPVSSIGINNIEAGGSLTSGGFDPLSTINPENIESIEILKDADATAIYGSRGANGVILITTKRASLNAERTNFDINIYQGIGNVQRKMELLNTQQYLAMRKEALANDGILVRDDVDYDLKYWDQNSDTDWQEFLTGGNASVADVQTSISSGNHNTSFRLGGGFHKETLVFPGDYGYYRISGQFSITHSSKNERFRLNFTTNYGLENNKLFTGDNVVASRLMLAPNAPKLYNDDGSLNWEMREINGVMTSTWANPLSYMQNSLKSINTQLISSANFFFKLLPGLELQTSAGYSNSFHATNSKVTSSSIPPELRSPGVRALGLFDTKQASWIIEPKLAYAKKFGGHELNIIAGSTWQVRSRDLNYTHATNFTSDALMESISAAGRYTVPLDEKTEYKYTSMYARIGYNWQQKYLINFTGRRDGSSRFGPNNRFGNFGAIGVGWIFSTEDWIKKTFPVLTFGKLRSSYGIIGSDAVSDYQYYDLYKVLDAQYQQVTGLIPNQVFNPDFKWENTKKLEVALDLGFLDNRFGMEISWYRNRSSNQLVDYQLSEVTGFSSVTANFGATVQNSGLEGVLNAKFLGSGKLKWNTSFNVSFPRNKLLRFDGIEDSPYVNVYKVGEPLSIRYLFTYKGVNTQTGYYEFQDSNNDGTINNLDRRLMIPMDREYYGGINNTLKFKEFECSFLFQFSKQPGLRYLPGLPGTRDRNQPLEVLERWFAPGDHTDVQRFSTGVNRGQLEYNYYLGYSDYNTEDASFIRLKTLSLAYSFYQRWLKKIKLDQAKLFIQGQNLLTITNYSGLDPETGSGVPPLRMFTAGIQIRL